MTCNIACIVIGESSINTYTVDRKGNIIEYINGGDRHPRTHPGEIIGQAQETAAQSCSSLQVVYGPDPNDVPTIKIYYTGLNGLLCDWRWNSNLGWHSGVLRSSNIYVQTGTNIQYAILYRGLSRVGYYAEDGIICEADEGAVSERIDDWEVEEVLMPPN